MGFRGGAHRTSTPTAIIPAVTERPQEPHTDATHTLHSRNPDGSRNETEITAGHALDLAAGQAVAYFPRDEHIAVDEHGTIIRRDSAVPQSLDS
jgi:hypothetical protein